MPVKKLSVALDPQVAEAASKAAHRAGISFSAWLGKAAERELLLDQGLVEVKDWESEHGGLTRTELASADSRLAKLLV